MALSTTIKSIQDIMRKDVGVDGDAQRIGQLVWLLFLKIWDDREQELELLEDDFVSPLLDVRWTDAAGETHKAPDLRWRAWAANPEGRTGDALLALVNDTLFPALKGLETGTHIEDDPAAEALRRRRVLVKGVFEDAYQYMKSGTLLRQVINKVQEEIDFNDSRKRHLFGDIYEQLLRDLQGAGNAGEYYTPRAVTQFAVDIVDRLEPADRHRSIAVFCDEPVRRRKPRYREIGLPAVADGILARRNRHVAIKQREVVDVLQPARDSVDIVQGHRAHDELARRER